MLSIIIINPKVRNCVLFLLYVRYLENKPKKPSRAEDKIQEETARSIFEDSNIGNEELNKKEEM